MHRLRSCANILEHQPALWRFVTEEGVEPTNNHAEQELRGFVLWRKSSLGSQSARGDRFAANLKSVVHTCRKQQPHVLNYLVAAIQAAFRRLQQGLSAVSAGRGSVNAYSPMTPSHALFMLQENGCLVW